jgi:hypothetical protein
MPETLINRLMHGDEEDEEEESAIAEVERRDRTAQVRKLSGDQRKERAKIRRRRQKKGTMTYDLPNEIIEAVREASSELDISQSNIVALALVEWLNRYSAGEIDFSEELEVSRTPRFLWRVPIPPLDSNQ